MDDAFGTSFVTTAKYNFAIKIIIQKIISGFYNMLKRNTYQLFEMQYKLVSVDNVHNVQEKYIQNN